jgi:hypothetical protein
MYAHVGDRLVVEGDWARAGLIIGVPHGDGTPPYIVKWFASGSIAMVVPNPFARIVPANPAVGPRPHEEASPGLSPGSSPEPRR